MTTVTQAQMVANIKAYYNGKGKDWYLEARGFAQSLSNETGIELDRVAAIISVLSPQLSWQRNKAAAEKTCREKTTSNITGVLNTSKAKAQRLLDGEAIDAVLNGAPKTGAFFNNIKSGGFDDYVTVDRHAICIAHNCKDVNINLTPKRYAQIAEAYRIAARELSKELGQTITPAQVQACTWCNWRGSEQ